MLLLIRYGLQCVLPIYYFALLNSHFHAAAINLYTVCADLAKDKIDNLNQGILPIYEPGLEEMVKRNAEKKRLTFSANPSEAVKGVDVIFVAVGTPSRSDGVAHLGYVDDVAQMVAENITKDVVLVLKSTVPVKVRDSIPSFAFICHMSNFTNRNLSFYRQTAEFAILSKIQSSKSMWCRILNF